MKFNIAEDTSGKELANILKDWFTYQNLSAYEAGTYVEFKGAAWRIWNVDIQESGIAVSRVLVTLMRNHDNKTETLRNFTYILVQKMSERLAELMSALEEKGLLDDFKKLAGYFINERLPVHSKS